MSYSLKMSWCQLEPTTFRKPKRLVWEKRETYQWSHPSSSRPRWVPISVKHSGSAVSAPEFWPNKKNNLQPSGNCMKLLVCWEIDIEFYWYHWGEEKLSLLLTVTVTILCFEWPFRGSSEADLCGFWNSMVGDEWCSFEKVLPFHYQHQHRPLCSTTRWVPLQ